MTFLENHEGSLPLPHDSFPDAGEATNDFWSMSGNFIYRHHVEPRVKLFSPREESFLIPLKYIDASRTTDTNLDVTQESRIDDYWNTDGSSDLSAYWSGVTQFILLEEKQTDICGPTTVRLGINRRKRHGGCRMKRNGMRRRNAGHEVRRHGIERRWGSWKRRDN